LKFLWEAGQMRNSGLLIFTIVVAICAVIYVGGAVHVRGAPIFFHIDKRMGSTALMNTHYKMMYLLRRRDSGEKEDEWTKTYQDFDKVLKKTVE
jgi:hypothetical protein